MKPETNQLGRGRDRNRKNFDKPARKPSNGNRARNQGQQNGRGGQNQGQNSNQAQQQGEKRPTVSRGAAVRAQKRSQMDAQRVANQYMPAQVDEKVVANFIDDTVLASRSSVSAVWTAVVAKT
jgi:hypothetical protein